MPKPEPKDSCPSGGDHVWTPVETGTPCGAVHEVPSPW